MYAVICRPKYWEEISSVISSLEEHIVFSKIQDEIDFTDEMEQINRISIKHLIIDITAIQSLKEFLRSIKNYRIMNDRTQIIIIAPFSEPGNELLHSLVSMGIYDILAPADESIEDNLAIAPLLINSLKDPSSYKRAVRWIIDNDNSESQVQTKTNKIKSKEYHDSQGQNVIQIMKNDIVQIMKNGLKETMLSWGWDSSGKSFFIVNLAVKLAKSGSKVALIEGNLNNFELFSYFQIEEKHEGLDILLKNSMDDDILDHAFKPIKNLFVFASMPSIVKPKNLDVGLFKEKLRDKVDFILLDNPSTINNDLINNMRQASKVFVVVTPNIAKLAALSQNLISLSEAGINLGKFEVILNFYTTSKLISPESVSSLLNINTAAVIPPMFPGGFESHMKGKPITLSSEGKEVEDSLSKILDSLWITKNSKKSFISRFKK
jgi:septum site-determining protein MinD